MGIMVYRRRLFFAFPVLCQVRWDVAPNMREAKLNHRIGIPESVKLKALFAYTRQWDKMCDTSCFTAQNTEILSYSLVFKLLETAFMQ